MYPAAQDLGHGGGGEGGRGESGQTGSHSGLPDQAGESSGECPSALATKGCNKVLERAYVGTA